MSNHYKTVIQYDDTFVRTFFCFFFGTLVAHGSAGRVARTNFFEIVFRAVDIRSSESPSRGVRSLERPLYFHREWCTRYVFCSKHCVVFEQGRAKTLYCLSPGDPPPTLQRVERMTERRTTTVFYDIPWKARNPWCDLRLGRTGKYETKTSCS